MIRYTIGVLRGRVHLHNPVACPRCADVVMEVTRRDAKILAAHRHLLCPCGGYLTRVYVPAVETALTDSLKSAPVSAETSQLLADMGATGNEPNTPDDWCAPGEDWDW